MQLTHFTLVALGATALLAGRGLAQNDDCTGALPVVDGMNGPFTNVGATTSAPAWPCATGGNDVWFSYVATATGSTIFRTCGAGYDTALQVFDGAGGCGALVSLGCNDDSCGLQSSLTIPTVMGTTYFVRVGGYNSATGTFPLEIGTSATATSFGTSCGARTDSVYEYFATAAAMDLGNTAMSMVRTGAGVIVLPGLTTYVTPTAAATSLVLTDDSETTVPLSTPMPYGVSGSTSSLTVCSNGFVSVASGNGTTWTPTAAAFLSAPQMSWRSWHDYNPTIAGSGQVKFEEVGGFAYVTWDGVFDHTTTGPGSTFQFQFDLTTGDVHYVWQSISGLGNAHLVGYSPGGPSSDAGSVDLSAQLPNTMIIGATNITAIALSASAAPISGTTISLNTNNLQPTVPFGAVLLSLTQFNPGINLTGLGMAGCEQYTGGDVTLLFLPMGAPSAATSLTVPTLPGYHIYAQSAVYDPASGLTQLGATTSNALDLGIGSL